MVGAGERIKVSHPEGGSAAESALIRAALAGDRTALEQLLRPHRRGVVAVCYGILGNAEDAEDAAQETFLRALRGLSRFRGDAAFHSWLIRIALNLCFSWKRSRRPTQMWEEDFSRSGAASPEVIAVSHLRLMQALDTLPPRRRAALLLKEWEGCSMAEIGALMGWNEDRVKNELYRARRALVNWHERETAEGDDR
jgi:RNA polymerase sigma-70 factor (ECF subfamily)